MAGELEILKDGFEKKATIPAEGPKWGTPPETSMPGEQHPEGLDENGPVGDDAQNTRYLKANFENADMAEADMINTLSDKLDNFNTPTRISSSQLIKNYPKTNTRVLRAMSETIKSQLGV